MCPDLAVPSAMRSYRFPALGTEVRVLLPVDQGEAITPVRELFAEWESTLSRFRPDSELSVLNAWAGEPVAVGPILFDVVSASVDAARATEGVFDPTLERQLARVGYDTSFERLQRSLPPAVGPAEPGGGWRRIVLDPRTRTVCLPRGCSLDVGGIAKGMAVDAAIELLTNRGVSSALVSAGGDLVVLGLPPGAQAWAVRVGDDVDGDVVLLSRGALATSGSGRRWWVQGGILRHHLIDPVTGEPAESDLHEVTVAASTCRVAEVAATVVFVVGAERGAAFLLARGLAGVLVQGDGRRTPVGRWPSGVRDAA